METDRKAVRVKLAQVVHDLVAKKSFVKLVWTEDDRRLHLPIPFGTELEGVHAAAEEALRQHERDIHTTSVAVG
jgi:hypothetical protein